jgi:hypothetical protein
MFSRCSVRRRVAQTLHKLDAFSPGACVCRPCASASPAETPCPPSPYPLTSLRGKISGFRSPSLLWMSSFNRTVRSICLNCFHCRLLLSARCLCYSPGRPVVCARLKACRRSRHGQQARAETVLHWIHAIYCGKSAHRPASVLAADAVATQHVQAFYKADTDQAPFARLNNLEASKRDLVRAASAGV